MPDIPIPCVCQTVALLEEYACERFGAAAVETVDGDTPAAARHDAVQRFNAPDDGDRVPGFLFLGAARCCGLGTNLPTVNSVVLFDSDWDARADIQARLMPRHQPMSCWIMTAPHMKAMGHVA